MTELKWSELWDETEQRYRVQTRDGRKVRIWTTKAISPDFPVQGEYEDPGSVRGWDLCEWETDGGCELNINLDLLPEPRTVRRWVNVYHYPNRDDKYMIGAPYADEQTARSEAASHAIATVPVEWTE